MREVAGIGKSAELPRFGDGALGVLQEVADRKSVV